MRGLLSAFALLLCGCATAVPLAQWTKPGAVRGQVETDVFICRQWSDWGTPGVVNQAQFEQCMLATGWTLATASPSPDTVAALR